MGSIRKFLKKFPKCKNFGHLCYKNHNRLRINFVKMRPKLAVILHWVCQKIFFLNFLGRFTLRMTCCLSWEAKGWDFRTRTMGIALITQTWGNFLNRPDKLNSRNMFWESEKIPNHTTVFRPTKRWRWKWVCCKNRPALAKRTTK